jgi:hypothetical protein
MKELFLIILVLILLLSKIGYHAYIKHYGRFLREPFWKAGYVEQNKKNYIKKEEKELTNKNKLFQTFYNKSKIPNDVYENIKKYAPEYEHIILDDNDLNIFFQTYYTDIVLDAFNRLNGAHKADLARYCLLYIYGGVYMDIKTELIKPLSEIFRDNDKFYTVIADSPIIMYQGIIKSPPKNPLFLSLIDFIATKNIETYHDLCRDMLIQIQRDTGIKSGYRKGKSGNKYYLFKEKCSSKDNSLCYDGFDRYGYCCFIWEQDKTVIKCRRSSYPWK